MAKFDVHSLRGGVGLVVDCQSDLNASLPTRLVVPLVRSRSLQPLDVRLNPVFSIEGAEFVFAVQGMQTVATRLLDRRVGSLADHDIVIIGAIDRLINGI